MSPLKWFGRGRGPSVPPPPPPDQPAVLRGQVHDLVRRVNAASGHLPASAVPDIREICDQISEMLDFVERASHTGATPDTYAMTTLTATVEDYLPTSVDTYLALPEHFLDTHRNTQGESPAEELSAQLRSMRTGVAELANAMYAGDAQRLSAQSRFLDAKFLRSDLDL